MKYLTYNLLSYCGAPTAGQLSKRVFHNVTSCFIQEKENSGKVLARIPNYLRFSRKPCNKIIHDRRSIWELSLHQTSCYHEGELQKTSPQE